MSHIIATAESYAIRCGELAKENDLLRRQVDALANDMARTAPPENYPNHYDDWLELLWVERVQWWVKWALAKAKEGGGGE